MRHNSPYETAFLCLLLLRGLDQIDPARRQVIGCEIGHRPGSPSPGMRLALAMLVHPTGMWRSRPLAVLEVDPVLAPRLLACHEPRTRRPDRRVEAYGSRRMRCPLCRSSASDVVDWPSPIARSQSRFVGSARREMLDHVPAPSATNSFGVTASRSTRDFFKREPAPSGARPAEAGRRDNRCRRVRSPSSSEVCSCGLHADYRRAA